MAKQINFNVSGTPTDVPTIWNDDPTQPSHLGVFEGTPPNRCVFILPDTLTGGGHLRWASKQINFLLPPPGVYEAEQLGLPALVYAGAAMPNDIRVSGAEFVTASGAPWPWCGVSDFRLLERIVRGEDIDPLLQQRREVGFNLVRVLAMKTNNTGWSLDPGLSDYWRAVAALFEATKDAGLCVEWTVFADTRTVMPQLRDQQRFWEQAVDAARAQSHVFLELLNEYGHGTQAINPLEFPRPDGVLTSHGSGLTDAHPVEPFWDYATGHARREPDARGFTNYDPYEWERDYPKPCPIVMDEGIKPPNYGYSLDYARRIGQHARCGAGGTFHWDGGIDSRLMDEREFRCGEAFCEAMR